MTEQPAGASESAPYRVLARKYRPSGFDDLIGQDALVQTLTNAFESGRIAHAFILTGVRGVGKTTAARIIARALNCVGPGGDGGPTARPCGACEHCTAIAGDRHVDVIEMDAASRTGVGDIRELIDAVRYRPVRARYKVYIIDEVHMLSNSAFNALLKTLEEPPEHVIFIFATTEIRKLPVTVLSRCQRFDLRRVGQEPLAAHFAQIAAEEKVSAAPAALAMIARAADGSVRDGLSLLDQAIVLGDGTVAESVVRDMLGLADRNRVFDLFEAIMAGKTAEGLQIFEDLYAAGADPAVVLQDLLEIIHFLTRVRLVPDAAEGRSEIERVRGGAMAEKLPMPALTRTWQILLKGLGETQSAPAPRQAAEMVLIRLAYASNLPTPADLLKQITNSATSSASPPAGTAAPTAPRESTVSNSAGRLPAPGNEAGARGARGGQEAALRLEPAVQSKSAELPDTELRSFAEVVELARRKREVMLANYLADDVHLVHFEPGRIEFRPGERAPPKLAGQLSDFLQSSSGQRWVVSVSSDDGQLTLRAQERALEADRRRAIMEHPLVRKVLETFPDAKLVDRRDVARSKPPQDESKGM